MLLGTDANSQAATKSLGLTLFGHSLNPWVDVLIVLAFGAVMVGFAVSAFSKQE